MDGFENGNNPYGQEYGDPFLTEDPAVRIQIEYLEFKRKRRLKALLTTGCIFTVAGILAVVLAAFLPAVQQSEPVNVCEADMEDQYVYTPVQYLTDAVACYDTFEQMRFYIALDQDWNPAVVCIHDEDLKEFEPYREWFYSGRDTEGMKVPGPARITGYARPFDSGLKEYVMQGFEEISDPGYVAKENFNEWFGSYYVQAGAKSYAYPATRAGVCLIISGILLLTASAFYVKGKPGIKDDGLRDGWYGGAQVEAYHPAAGVLGSLMGALLGGLLWTVVGALGFFTGWIGLLIILFANIGYEVMTHRKSILGNIVSFLFGVLVILPSAWLSYGWSYYRALNEGIHVNISLGRAFRGFMSNMGKSGYEDMWMDVKVGYLFLAAAGISWLFSAAAQKVRSNRGNRI